MPLILGANSVSGGYEIDNSLRFNSGSSDYLARTPSSTTNQQIFTFSTWFKFSDVSATYNNIASFGASSVTNGVCYIDINSSKQLEIFMRASGTEYKSITTQLFRDVSAWYHIIIAVDTTQATSTNRTKVYVNGSQVTSFSTQNAVPQNTNLLVNTSSSENRIGASRDSGSTLGSYFNGYQSEVNLIDGQQLTPSSFGETDQDTNIWIPKAYTGSFGTNGFYLEFQNSGALGTDSSGNGNTFTVNNLTSIDQTTDTPTNNFATLNPLDAGGGGSYAEGNLQFTSATSDLKASASSFALNNGNAGKWYWEVKMVSTTGSIYQIGTISSTSSYIAQPYSQYASGGQVYVNGSQITTVATYTTNDIISVAFDATISEVKYFKNGSLVTTQTITNSNNILMFAGSHSDSSGNTATYQFNFGNPPFTISSGNADADGFGNFEYAVPSGYFALCTKNLSEYA